MVNYETVFIISPLLTEEQVQEVAGKFRDVLLNHQAEIVNEENWGLRKLAYPIRKKSNGFYYLIEYKSDPTVVSRLEIEYKRDERIMRYITVKQDKHALEFSERRRRGDFRKDRKATSTASAEKIIIDADDFDI